MNKLEQFKRSGWGLGWMVVLMLALAACQPAAAAEQSAPAGQSAPASQATAAPEATQPAATKPAADQPVTEPVIQVVEDPQYGKILVDGDGMTLYGFTKDEPNKSNCAGGCLEAWPPLLTAGEPQAGEGVDASLLGATSLPDGRKIVTYNGLPLYYWVSDKKPGDTLGQDVNKVWYVVSPEGKMVMGPVVPATGGESSSGAAAQDGVTVRAAEAPGLGVILVDGKGMTLYMFKKDAPDTVNCAGGCLEAWPPLLATSDPVAGEGVDAALLGAAPMPDGSRIVTYNRMPLYYFAKDAKPGDVTGQDVNDVWYVVAPDGKPVERSASSSMSGDDANDNDSNSSSDDVKLRVSNHPTLGNILVDDRGMTLYMFTKDGPNQSNCAGECLKAWPPMLATRDKVGAEDGVDEGLVGAAGLADGRKIVTYNGMPLYYWAGDSKPGDATGQGVNEVWYVVAPDGSPVR